MVRHNNVLPNVHLNKDWQEKVKTWLDQPGRKKRRRLNRVRKAKCLAPKYIIIKIVPLIYLDLLLEDKQTDIMEKLN